MELPEKRAQLSTGRGGGSDGSSAASALAPTDARHRELAEHYLRRRLSDSNLGFQADHPERIWQTFAVVLPAGISRKAVRAELQAEGIETQIASYGLHRLAAFRNAPRFAAHGASSELPVTDRLHDRGLALPLHSELSNDDVDRVSARCYRKAVALPTVRATDVLVARDHQNVRIFFRQGAFPASKEFEDEDAACTAPAHAARALRPLPRPRRCATRSEPTSFR
jgi:hypothetical protein